MSRSSALPSILPPYFPAYYDTLPKFTLVPSYCLQVGSTFELCDVQSPQLGLASAISRSVVSHPITHTLLNMTEELFPPCSQLSHNNPKVPTCQLLQSEITSIVFLSFLFKCVAQTGFELVILLAPPLSAHLTCMCHHNKQLLLFLQVASRV